MPSKRTKIAGGKPPSPQKKAKQPARFTPTAEDQRRVAAIVGAGVITDTARLIVVNPRTGRPLAKSTFCLRFKAEIAEGQKMTTARASATLAEAMGERTAEGKVTRAALTSSIFWLKTRESDLFSERQINENISKGEGNEPGIVDRKTAIKVAESILKQAAAEDALEKSNGGPSIDDKALGNA